jgi:hypothetical protein
MGGSVRFLWENGRTLSKLHPFPPTRHTDHTADLADHTPTRRENTERTLHLPPPPALKTTFFSSSPLQTPNHIASIAPTCHGERNADRMRMAMRMESNLSSKKQNVQKIQILILQFARHPATPTTPWPSTSSQSHFAYESYRTAVLM